MLGATRLLVGLVLEAALFSAGRTPPNVPGQASRPAAVPLARLPRPDLRPTPPMPPQVPYFKKPPRKYTSVVKLFARLRASGLRLHYWP